MKSITGKWRGSYTQLEGINEHVYQNKVEFEMELRENENGFEGSCRDLEMIDGEQLRSTIRGFVEDTLISFVKQYHKEFFLDFETGEKFTVDGERSHEINYYGRWDQAMNGFHGRWEIVVAEEETYDLGAYNEITISGDWQMKRLSD